MSSSIRKIFIMNIISSIIYIYVGIFINLYIWEAGQSISDVAWYNIVLFTGWSISYGCGTFLVHKLGMRKLITISAISVGLAFALLAWMPPFEKIWWLASIALPVGLSWGLYSATQNISLTIIGRDNDFSVYFAYSTLAGQVLSMIVPIIYAQVILKFGYSASFIAMIVFVIIMIIYAKLLPHLPKEESRISTQGNSGEPTLSPLGIFKQVGKQMMQPKYFWLTFSIFAAGIFLQFQNLFTLLFTFSVTQDKTLISLLNALYTLAGVGALFLYKRIKLTNMKWLWIGAALLSFGFIIVTIPMPTASAKSILLISSNVISAIGMLLFASTWNAITFNSIRFLSDQQRTMFLVWREWLLCISRILLLTIVLSLSDLSGWLFNVIVAFTVISLLTIPLTMNIAIKRIDRN
ncbi:MFS transporter [Paenibacillus sp. GSMTC-2017]|uniref:MFS transporter n=1 Tax=Paenibacillus sp. GSMTC-2017 TaxID=2794350 RepID=UPI0018D9CD3C|nr:MFS transporter [Paenibacillus sp. GSMTC-2017]MBH5317491.1 MFS transporter [Paenibacillus sp. GSMTC-2017]